MFQDFEQRLYIGNMAYGNTPEGIRSGAGTYGDLPAIRLYADELGWRCRLYAESHVAEPDAQFRDYILDDVTRFAMRWGMLTDLATAGSAYKPQELKRICQGVGGHLGEGAAILALEQLLVLRPAEIAHLAVRTGQRRCPDFVLTVSLNRLYQGYLLPGSPEMMPIPVPLECKSSRDEVVSIRSLLTAGAIYQLASYWWEMNRPRRRRVVGHGVVTVFCHQANILIHVLLRPKDQTSRLDLITYLASIRSPRRLTEVLNTDTEMDRVLNWLEGF